MTETETATKPNVPRSKRWKRRKGRKVVRQDAPLQKLVKLIKTAKREGESYADLAHRSLNPYTRKKVAVTTIVNWVEGYTGGSMMRTADGVCRALGKEIAYVDRR